MRWIEPEQHILHDARGFAMGTMELAWALDDLDGRSPNPQVVAFVKAALRDLTRPASPAA